MENSKVILHSTPISEIKELIKGVVVDALEEQTKGYKKQNDKLYTRQETATILGISLTTLNTYTKEGIINAYRLGTQIRYKYEDLDKALKKINVIKYSHKRK